MRNLLDLVFEYRSLLSNAEEFGDLAPQESERLDALEKLFGQEPGERLANPKARHRKHARCETSMPATVRVRGRTHYAELRNLGGGGICISPAPQMELGEIATLHLVNEDTQREFFYQVQASWSHGRGLDSCMGMPFIGKPDALDRATHDDRAAAH